MTSKWRIATAAGTIIVAASLAWAHSDQETPAGHGHHDVIEQMREAHADHDHHHDFEAMEAMSPEEMARVMDAMLDVGLAMRPMDPAHGRHLFVDKGCIVCHSAGGVGGEIGPSLNAEDMPKPMNVFEFAARMWHGAEAMAAMQRQLFGEQTRLTGQELADIIAFARARLAHFKCPTSVDFAESLPRNPSGKLLKRELRERYWQGRDRRIN